MEMDQNDQAVRFLLGKLTEQEQDAVEREFFQSTASFENILIAENALTDAYVSDRLSADDRLLYEQRLLTNPKQRQRAAFAQTLVSYASRLPVNDIDADRPAAGWLTDFVRLFSGRPLLSYSLGAAVLLLVAGGALWWTSLGTPPNRNDELAKAILPEPPQTVNTAADLPAVTRPPASDKEVNPPSKVTNAEPKTMSAQARPSRHDQNGQSDRSSRIISTIILPLASTRDGGTAKAFVIPKNSTGVNLQMQVEDEEFRNFFAVIETVDGQQVWRGKSAGPSGRSPAKTVTFTVPTRRLGTGDYIVALKGSAKGDVYQTVGEYAFTVDRR